MASRVAQQQAISLQRVRNVLGQHQEHCRQLQGNRGGQGSQGYQQEHCKNLQDAQGQRYNDDDVPLDGRLHDLLVADQLSDVHHQDQHNTVLCRGQEHHFSVSHQGQQLLGEGGGVSFAEPSRCWQKGGAWGLGCSRDLQELEVRCGICFAEQQVVDPDALMGWLPSDAFAFSV
eukprot:scaffold19480_cov15-Tisochrysis_lutea.AAC.1